MQEAKPWYLSAGVWGAFATLVGSGLSLLKFRLDPALLDDLRDWVLSLVTLVGGAVALYGRIRAGSSCPRPRPTPPRRARTGG